MPDYSSHSEVIKLLQQAQEAEHDLRNIVRETHAFIDKRDGQWEPEIWRRFGNYGRPRYTFDMCNPIIDTIAGEMEQADFDIVCKPADGDASDEVAKVFDGLIRNIENISNASEVYNQAGRSMVTAGIDGWRVTQEWADGDSFYQDLFIRKIPNFVDRVWVDYSSEMQSTQDAKWAFVLQVLPEYEYKKMWPEGSMSSVSDDRQAEMYSYKPQDCVTVGEFLYIKEIDRDIVLMSNGAVYEDNEEYQAVKDELAAAGITEVKRRSRPKTVCYSRFFDNRDWLDEEKETVFDTIPVVTTYGNFKITENKRLYRGAIEKNLDEQRVLNYALSRDIEQGALAPRDKIWMTEKQGEGQESQLRTLNTNADPVQFYNPDDKAPPPYRPTAATPNAGLQTTAANMKDMIRESSGLPPVAKGDNPGLQSGIAIDKLQSKSDTSSIKWFKSQECAIQRTAEILIKAAPKVYDTQRQVRILGEDGNGRVVTLNQVVIDEETGQPVTLNDLSQGKYDAVCSAGPSFVSRKQETVAAINELAQLDPSIIAEGGDVLLNSIPSPGIDLIAERRRARMIDNGMIPFDQLTDEEKVKLQQKLALQQQNPQPPSPEAMIGMAELQRAQTDANQQMIDFQNDQVEQAQKQQDLDRKDLEVTLKAQSEGIDKVFKQQEMQMKMLSEAMNQFKALSDAIGADALIGPQTANLVQQQADIVDEAQDNVDNRA